MDKLVWKKFRRTPRPGVALQPGLAHPNKKKLGGLQIINAWMNFNEQMIMRKIMHIIEHHLFTEEYGSHSEDKEICSSFVGMSINDIYLGLHFQIVELWCLFIYLIYC